MSPLTLLVPGMTCRHCVRRVTAALRDVPGVGLVQADLMTTTVVLHGDPAPADALGALVRVGFPGTVTPPPEPVFGPGSVADPAADAPTAGTWRFGRGDQRR